MKNIQKCAWIVLGVLLRVVVFSQPLPAGTLDPAFGSGGYYTFSTSGIPRTGLANGIAVQGNGRVVFSASIKGGGDNMVVVRLTEDGKLDTSFAGGAGFVLPPIPLPFVYEPVVVVQPNQKILGGGWGVLSFGDINADFVLIRLDSSGVPDAGFSTSTTDILFGSYDIAEGLDILPDGSIIQAGFSYTQWPSTDLSVISLVKYKHNGSLDSTFDTDGKRTLNFSAVGTPVHRWVGTAVAAQPDGKMVIAGYGLNSAGSYSVALVFRLLPNGSLDPAFGPSGGYSILYGFPGGYINPSFWALDLEQDGRIVLAGSAQNAASGKQEAMVVRLLPDGTMDGSFGTSLHPGIAVFAATGSGGTYYTETRGIVIDRSGHYVVGGRAGGIWMVGCLTNTGILETGFGPAGGGFGLYPPNNLIHAIAVDSSNRIVVAGDEGMTKIVVGRLGNYTSTHAAEKVVLPLHVWPNPTSGVVHVAFPVAKSGEALCRVTDAWGKVVLEYPQNHIGSGEQLYRIDLGSSLGAGVYWLSVETESEYGVTGFIKQ